jgi:hypothetical protein
LCPEDGSNYQELLLEMTGQKTVPNVFINKTHVGGCDKTMKVWIGAAAFMNPDHSHFTRGFASATDF